MEERRGPEGIRLGIARGVSYGLFGPPDDVVGPSRELGADLVRVYIYWGQVEPEPGRFDWTVVDALLAQLTGDEEVWVTVCSSSRWATRQPTDFLPPSPAKDAERYRRFAYTLVSHCAGRVAYWQCDNEPSNVGLLWAGTAEEYVAQLKVFRAAVRDADPRSSVVLGGCGYDVLSSGLDGPARRFFEEVVDSGRDAFDLFALNLYDDPEAIPKHVHLAREMMRANGFERPIVVGEYNGPTLFELPQLDEVMQRTMTAAFADVEPGGFDAAELATRATAETPERRAMQALYAAMPDLPPALQMFMVGCPAELAERRDRINGRELVTRNLLALSTGICRTVCWQLAPEVPNYEDPFTMMELMHGKLPLLRFEGGRLAFTPSAEAFRRLASQLEGAVGVEPIERGLPTDVLGFAVDRADRGRLTVLWKRGDLFAGEEEPSIAVRWPWEAAEAFAVDAFGAPQSVELESGHLHLAVGVTPIFLSARPPDMDVTVRPG
jgi:hypothetical protein